MLKAWFVEKYGVTFLRKERMKDGTPAFRSTNSRVVHRQSRGTRPTLQRCCNFRKSMHKSMSSAGKMRTRLCASGQKISDKIPHVPVISAHSGVPSLGRRVPDADFRARCVVRPPRDEPPTINAVHSLGNEIHKCLHASCRDVHHSLLGREKLPFPAKTGRKHFTCPPAFPLMA